MQEPQNRTADSVYLDLPVSDMTLIDLSNYTALTSKKVSEGHHKHANTSENRHLVNASDNQKGVNASDNQKGVNASDNQKGVNASETRDLINGSDNRDLINASDNQKRVNRKKAPIVCAVIIGTAILIGVIAAFKILLSKKISKKIKKSEIHKKVQENSRRVWENSKRRARKTSC